MKKVRFVSRLWNKWAAAVTAVRMIANTGNHLQTRDCLLMSPHLEQAPKVHVTLVYSHANQGRPLWDEVQISLNGLLRFLFYYSYTRQDFCFNIWQAWQWPRNIEGLATHAHPTYSIVDCTCVALEFKWVFTLRRSYNLLFPQQPDWNAVYH